MHLSSPCSDSARHSIAAQLLLAASMHQCILGVFLILMACAGAMSAATRATLPGSARCAQAAAAVAEAVATAVATATAEEAATGTATPAAGATASAALPRAAGAPPTRPRAPGAARRTSPALGAALPMSRVTAGVLPEMECLCEMMQNSVLSLCWYPSGCACYQPVAKLLHGLAMQWAITLQIFMQSMLLKPACASFL